MSSGDAMIDYKRVVGGLYAGDSNYRDSNHGDSNHGDSNANYVFCHQNDVMQQAGMS